MNSYVLLWKFIYEKEQMGCINFDWNIRIFSLSFWFSTSVIETELKGKWRLTPAMESWLSIAIPIGFVIGAFISSFLGLADRYNTRKFLRYRH